MTRSQWVRKAAPAAICLALLALVGCLAVRPSGTIEPIEAFSLCGERYALNEGYHGYDYGSRPHAELPAGHSAIHVRSAVEGDLPPVTIDALFAQWPLAVSNRLDKIQYTDWATALRATDAPPDSPTWTEISSSDECSLAISLRDSVDPALPRPSDWSVLLYSVSAGPELQGVEQDLADWRDRITDGSG